MVTLHLSNRCILVTGGLGAIAQHVIHRLLDAGAELVLTDIVPVDEAVSRLQSLALPSSNWTYVECDVTNEKMVEQAFRSILDLGKSINFFISLAGGCGLHSFDRMTVEEYRTIFDFNYYGHLLPAKALIALWLEKNVAGHMIFTSSLVGQLPWTALSAYAPAKAAIEHLAKCLALEFAEQGIRFNCVAPGHVASGSSLKVYEEDQAYRALVDRASPLKRLTRPEAVADAFVWLCSSMGDDVNGQVIHIDCGASIPKVG